MFLKIDLFNIQLNKIYITDGGGAANIEAKLNPNVIAELSYNYFNLGNNKPKVIDGLNNIQHRNYTVHNVLLGCRIKL